MPNVSLLRASFLAFCPLFAADELLVNRIGYELTGPKTAVVRNAAGAVDATGFEILDAAGNPLLSGVAGPLVTVPGWGKAGYRVLDFSTISDSGVLKLVTKPTGDTASFQVRRNNLLRTAGPAVVGYFTAMRNTDVGDAKIGYYGQPARGTHDVRGGWNDATGDDGKYLSHLNYANFMNPQQIPMVAWSVMRSRLLAPATTESFKDKIASEAAWGADYLLRVQDTAGYFYINVFREKWSGGNPKTICAWVGDSASQGNPTSDYQAAWREGGGMAIAALALAARTGVKGEFEPADYLAGAQRGFEHLMAKKGRWADDGRENLIDHYCALIAGLELFLATSNPVYIVAAAERADSIVARQNPEGWFVSDATTRPFFHGVDEGLPLMALSMYVNVDPGSERSMRIQQALAKSVAWYHSLTRQVANPFVYPRMYAPLAPVVATGSGVGGPGNVALGKKAWATEVEGSNAAGNAFDGIADQGHRWSAYRSGLPSDLGGFQANLAVDLAGNFLLSQMTISWEGAYATSYAVKVAGADTSNWTTVASTETGKGGKETIEITDSVWARYVKIECRKRALQYGGYSILEMTVTGTKDADPIPVEPTKVPSRAQFFMPHRNETGYWWQGENARLGSMAAGLLMAGRNAGDGWNFNATDWLSQEVIAPLDWVVGKNTSNTNFMFGVNGGDYAAYNGGTNRVGGICNGITSVSDTNGEPVFNNDGAVANWRWVEQWLPHNANFLLGAATIAHANEFPQEVGVKRSRGAIDGFRLVRRGAVVEMAAATASTWTLRSLTGRAIATSR
ncbi:MAG: discoidin domain-containing protein, partial [Fibrobacterota bacterium]